MLYLFHCDQQSGTFFLELLHIQKLISNNMSHLHDLQGSLVFLHLLWGPVVLLWMKRWLCSSFLSNYTNNLQTSLAQPETPTNFYRNHHTSLFFFLNEEEHINSLYHMKCLLFLGLHKQVPVVPVVLVDLQDPEILLNP